MSKTCLVMKDINMNGLGDAVNLNDEITLENMSFIHLFDQETKISLILI